MKSVFLNKQTATRHIFVIFILLNVVTNKLGTRLKLWFFNFFCLSGSVWSTMQTDRFTKGFFMLNNMNNKIEQSKTPEDEGNGGSGTYTEIYTLSSDEHLVSIC